MTEHEEWRTIPGFPDYRISNLGRVMSHRRSEPVVLVPQTATSGNYWKVLLRDADGKGHNRTIHVLVCEAFHGPRPKGLVVRHLDGDPLNNDPTNLKWGTESENAQDRVRHGNDAQARKTACIHGHGFTPGNTYITPDGARRCRTCHRRRDAESKIRRALRAAGISSSEVAA